MSKNNIRIIKVVERELDGEIIRIVRSILSNANWTIETINEAVLVKLMELRGTPIKYEKTLRDIERDFAGWVEEEGK